MALDRVMHFGKEPRSELEMLKIRRDELGRLMAAERNAAGHSNEWERMAIEHDRLSDEIGGIQKDAADEERRSSGPVLTSRDVANYET